MNVDVRGQLFLGLFGMILCIHFVSQWKLFIGSGPGLLQVYSRSVVASMWVKFLFPDNWFMPSTRSKEVKTNGSFNENIPPHWLENWFSVRPWCPKSQWGKGLPPFRRNSLDEIVRIGSNLILTTLKTACQRPQKLPYSENIEITH